MRGYIGGATQLAGVKVVGDFVDNYKKDLPSEFGLLALFAPHTGMPRALLDATAITDMRTGAVTAIGAKYLARKNSRVLAHIGARGTAYWNVRLLDRLFDFDEIRVHSRRKESQDAFAERLSRDLGKPERSMSSWQTTLPQQAQLLPWKTLRENVELSLVLRHVAAKEREQRVREILAAVGLSGFENHYPHQLSGGMQKRASIARTLIYAPAVVLMDEPFGARAGYFQRSGTEAPIRVDPGRGSGCSCSARFGRHRFCGAGFGYRS